ncbi:MAG TPA: hypothetical protein VGN04_12105 [Herbaspirillum sp.]|jgi:hypothetical protein
MSIPTKIKVRNQLGSSKDIQYAALASHHLLLTRFLGLLAPQLFRLLFLLRGGALSGFLDCLLPCEFVLLLALRQCFLRLDSCLWIDRGRASDTVDAAYARNIHDMTPWLALCAKGLQTIARSAKAARLFTLFSTKKFRHDDLLHCNK